MTAAPLRRELAAFVEVATALKRTRLATAELHQVIVGPAQSGKSTQAYAYAEALAEAGLVENKRPVVIDVTTWMTPEEVNKAFDAAKGGVLIIKDAHDMGGTIPNPGMQTLRSRAVMAIDLKQNVLLFTGREGVLEPYLKAMPEMERRLPRFLKLDKAFTPSEIRDFLADSEATMKRQQEAEEFKRVANTWRNVKKLDVTVGKRVAAPKTAVFSKKKGPAA